MFECILIVLLGGILYSLVVLWKTWQKAKTDLLKNFVLDGTTKSVATLNCQHAWEVVDRGELKTPHENKYVLVQKCTLCGLIDKTIEVTSKAPEVVLPKSECRHKWALQSVTNLESAYEQLIKGLKAKKIPSQKEITKLEHAEMTPWMFQKKYAEVRICSQCGEINKTIVSNFDMKEEE